VTDHERRRPGVLHRQGFRDLLIGQAISALGDWMGTVAFMALVLAITKQSLAVGGILVLRLAPAGVAGPLAARLVTRWNRRRTMIVMDLVRVGVVAVVPLVGALWWVYLWAFLLEGAGLVFLPARDASIPDLVDEQDLPLANGLMLGSSYGMIPVGAGAFALVTLVIGGQGLSSTTGIRPAFWVDSVTFVASAALVARIPELSSTGPRVPGGSGSFLGAFRLPVVRRVAIPAFCVSLGLGTLFSLGIVFVRDVLSASDTQFGLLIALFGVGAAVGLAVLRAVGVHGVRPVQVCVAGQGLLVALMSLSPGIGLTFLGAAGFGAFTAAGLAAAMSLLQESLPERQRVMAFAAFHVIIRAGLSMAALGAGAASEVLRGVRWPVVGRLAPARVVLLSAGLTVLVSSTFVSRMGRLEGVQRAVAALGGDRGAERQGDIGAGPAARGTGFDAEPALGGPEPTASRSATAGEAQTVAPPGWPDYRPPAT
jgi:MFS family permease